MNYAAILDSVTDQVAVLSPDGDLSYLNPAAARFLGAPPAALVGKNLWEMFPGATESQFYRECQAALREQSQRSFETYWPQHEVWLEFRLFPAEGSLTVMGRDVTAQHGIRRAIAETEMWLRLAQQAANVGAWDWDLTSGKLVWSPPMWDLLGIPAGSFEPTPDDWIRFIHPEDRERILARSEEMLSHSSEFSHEYRIVRASGETIWILSLGRVYREEGGGVRRLVGLIIDVTDRKRSEWALADSEARYEFTTEALPQAVWMADADGTLLECNRYWYELTGLTEADTRTANGWSQAIHPEDLAQFGDAWNRHRESGTEYTFEYRIRRAADGAYRWHLGRATPVRDAAGAVVRWLGTALDIQEIKEATEQVRRGEELYRAVIEQAGDPFWLVSEGGECLEVNGAACALLGYEREELLGADLRRLFHPEDQLPREEDLARARAGETVRSERRLRHKDGRYILVEGSARVIAENRALVFFRDVTRRREAEEALRAREREFRAIFNLAAVGVSEAEVRTGRFIRVNPRLCEMTGYTEAELVGKPFQEVTHPDDREANAECVAPVQQGERESWSIEKRYLRKDGTAIWVQVEGRLVRDQEGQPSVTLAVIQDITEARSAREALLRSNRALRDAQRMSHLGSWVLDLSTGEAWWSEQMYRIFDLDPARFTPSLEGTLPHLHPDDRDMVESQVAAAIRTGASFHDLELRVIHPDGTTGWFVSQGEVDLDERGRPVRLRGSCLDITERKHLELELQARARALTDEAKRKDEFLAMLAHELRNPLAPISHSAEILKLRGDVLPVVDEQREIIERNSRHLERLVDDLLEVSRINEGKIELRRERVELGALVQQAAAGVLPAMEERGHELSVSVPPEPVCLHADGVRLVQILTNLLTNAVKYTDRGGRITLAAACEGNAPVVRVRDNGRGIDADFLPCIFDLFVQGERTEARSEGGLGIGLTLGRRLAEMHGGTLTAHSEGRGCGSEFVLRLPAELLAPHAAPREAAPVNPEENHRRVLIVEDNVDAAETLAELLELWGHEVRVVHDGELAVECAAAFRPEVLLLDIGLPRMDGYQVVKRLEREGLTGSAVVIAMTGYGDQEHQQRARAAGFHHYLTKPVDLSLLQRLLAEGVAVRSNGADPS